MSALPKFLENPIRLKLILLYFGIAMLLPGLGDTALVDWDENIYAEAARQMVERGDYLNIYINDYPFAEKPPLFFWEQALSYHLWGVNEFAARFPSVVAGLIMIVFCFEAGRRIRDEQLGTLWALVYLTCLLPGVFARSAVIDHTFNAFIAVATFLLYRYDLHFEQWRTRQTRFPRYRSYLWGASVCMGLAVLTKGPLGGVIPLVAFASYKVWAAQRKTVPVLHFLWCGAVSLSVALSWYIINTIVYGTEFIEGFIWFQLSLFSRPLEGHEGPFFYHWIVGLVGLFPWTPFLFLQPKTLWNSAELHVRNLTRLAVGWIGFVLILFSLVTTKLPHYSASMYWPLSLLIALQLHDARGRLPRWSTGVLGLWGVAMAVGLCALPFIAEDYLAEVSPEFVLTWSDGIYWTSGGMLLTMLAGTYLLAQRKFWEGVAVVGLSMIFCVQGLWRYQVPMIQSYIQTPLVELVREAHTQEQQVVLYRYVSFAALFYGQRPLEMLHTYKFPNDPEVLNRPNEQPLAVITERKLEKSLRKAHPRVQFVKHSGNFALYEIPAGTP
jgi:4-amino-4-deoxy-L-arabinose transferase-like glycosyltransferase